MAVVSWSATRERCRGVPPHSTSLYFAVVPQLRPGISGVFFFRGGGSLGGCSWLMTELTSVRQ